jgi:phytoene dehydrogenase-like protein
VALKHGAEVRTGAQVQSVKCDEVGVVVQVAGGEAVHGSAAILAGGPRAACDLLELSPSHPLSRWAMNCLPVKAACLDLALRGLPQSQSRAAIGLDRPHYLSVHSASAKLAPDGVAVIHLMKYLGGDAAAAAWGVEDELEALLDRVQPGWRERVVTRRFLPKMTAAHALSRADEGGLAGRPKAVVDDRPNVFLAGDWVGERGWLADASAASAEEASRLVLASLNRFSSRPDRRMTHAGR